MYICLHDICVDIIVSLCVCRDAFWITFGSSFQGGFVQTMSVLTRLQLDGNPPRAILMLGTTEASLI